jgi:hypothetical protein
VPGITGREIAGILHCSMVPNCASEPKNLAAMMARMKFTMRVGDLVSHYAWSFRELPCKERLPF